VANLATQLKAENPAKSGGLLVNRRRTYYLSVTPEVLISKLDAWLGMVAENCRDLSKTHASIGEHEESRYWLRRVAEIELFLIDRRTISSIDLVAQRQRLLADPEITPINISTYVEALLKEYEVEQPKHADIEWVLITDEKGQFRMSMRPKLSNLVFGCEKCAPISDTQSSHLNAMVSSGTCGADEISRICALAV
jgi:hypothetical protein